MNSGGCPSFQHPSAKIVVLKPVSQCQFCNRSSPLISGALGVCKNCIRDGIPGVFERLGEIHKQSRREFSLPLQVPRSPSGVICSLCGNKCSIPEGERGYCGLRANRGGELLHLGGTEEKGILDWYFDPLPTNCVAEWVCGERNHYGFKNLAVFYRACTFNCLFCQNWHFRKGEGFSSPLTSRDLANCVDDRTACICYFGGDPTPQMEHALKVSNLLFEENKKRPLRICWETNGSMNPHLLDEAVRLSMESGGCVKFDLKAWDDNLHRALTGVSNRRTLENFKRVAKMTSRRPHPPLLIASTLLVPGYVDDEEVENIARFIASINPEIPYTLLAFYPCFYLKDLPTTPRKEALKCERVALQRGLRKVRIGNVGLLS